MQNGFGERGEVVSAYIEVLEPGEVPETRREDVKLVVAQVEALQLREALRLQDAVEAAHAGEGHALAEQVRAHEVAAGSEHQRSNWGRASSSLCK